MPISAYFKTNTLKMGLYGFICGMSLLLSGNTLNFWLASSSIDIKIVGFFALAALPYSFKYLLAILIDKYHIPYFYNKIGSHKSWLLFSQLMLVCLLVLMSFLSPNQHLLFISLVSFLIALFSVIQDIVLNGNRISTLKEDEQSIGTAMYTVGYRIGMIFSGAGIVFASAFISWSSIYLIMALIYLSMTIVMFISYVNFEVSTKASWTAQGVIHSLFLKPIECFGGYKNTIWIMLFIILYLLPDNMLMVMLNSFLLHQSYDAVEIASVSKAFGTIMVIIGGLIGGGVINKIGLRKSLLLFCACDMLGHPLFIILHYLGKNIIFLYFITGFTAFTGGMLTVGYIMFISKLSEGKYASTLYALLSSAMGLSRVLFPSISGVAVDNYGWVIFFITISVASLISLIFIWIMPKTIYNISKSNN